MKKLNKENLFIYIMMLLITIIIMSPLLQFDTYILGHDSQFHISNISAIKDAFTSGNFFFPKVYSLIANGFGYGTGLFYGPITHYITAIIAYLFPFLSIVSSMKIVHILVVLFSMIFMYQFVVKISNNKYAALLSSVIYITFPYFLSDIFVRDAFAESTVFVYIPLIFNGLYELLYTNNKRKFYLLFVPSVSLLFMTHLISTVYMAIIVLIYILLNIKLVIRNKKIKTLIVSLVFILGICSYYWIPMLEQKIFADINIFNSGASATIESVISHALNIFDFIPIPGNQSFDGIQYFILIPVILLLFFSIFNYKETNLENKKNYKSFIVLFIISLFMSTKYFPWKILPEILLFIQFPWRMLLFVTFFASIISTLCICNIKENISKYISLGLIIVILCSILPLMNLNRVQYFNEKDINISEAGLGAIRDYLPTKTINNYEYYKNREHDIKILSGEGTVEILNFKAPFISFIAKLESDKMIIELPLLYYYGYNLDTIYIDTDLEGTGKGTKKISKIEESENGFVQLTITNSQKGTINFSGSKATQISLYISIFSMLSLIIYLKKR